MHDKGYYPIIMIQIRVSKSDINVIDHWVKISFRVKFEITVEIKIEIFEN